MALTQEQLLNLQRFAPITRPTSPYSNSNNPPQQVRTFLPATRSSNPYASLMALTPQQRIAGSSGGFDPSIYKKLPGLLTTPATGTVSGGNDGRGSDEVGGGGGGGNLGVGPGQGVSSDAQRAALSLISLADKYPAILPGGIFAKVLGLLGGLTADSQTSKMAEAQKAIEAIDKQNAAALESGSSRTFDPYGGTKGVLSVSDANGNVRAFDPYAGDSAKDADKSKALADSGLSTASNFVGPMPKSDTYTGDFVGPMPQNNTFSGGLLGDFAERQDEADAAVIASDNAARENAAITAALANTTGIDLSAPSFASTTFQGSAYGPAVAAAADKAAALESGSSRTFDPYGGTKGVLSVSDANGNVRSFDPYAGDSAKDADRAAALSASIADAREARDIENAAALGPAPAVDVAPAVDYAGEFFGPTLPSAGVAPSISGEPAVAPADTSTAALGLAGLLGADTALDNLGDRPQSNPTASLPSTGYTGTTLGLLGDILGGSAVSLDAAPVETREATPNPAYAEQQAQAQAQQAYAEQQAQAQREYANMTRQAEAQAQAQAQQAQAQAEAQAQANREASFSSYDGGGGGTGSGDGNSGGEAGGGYGAQYRGGLITFRDVKGPNPPGPDDGLSGLDIGEYVIRKKAVKKYGANIFEQINAGQIPARRLKSLLE